MLTLEKKGFRYEDWQLGDEVYYEKKDGSGKTIKANIIGFQENNLSEFILIDCYDKSNVYSYNINISEIVSTDIIHYCESNRNQITWVNPKDLVLIKPYNDVLRYKYIKFDRYYIAKIIYQNFEILKREEFRNTELNIYSVGSPEFKEISENRIYIQGSNKEDDDEPLIIKEKFFNDFKERINKLNDLYVDHYMNIGSELKDINDHIRNLKRSEQIQYIKTIKQILNI